MRKRLANTAIAEAAIRSAIRNSTAEVAVVGFIDIERVKDHPVYSSLHEVRGRNPKSSAWFGGLRRLPSLGINDGISCGNHASLARYRARSCLGSQSRWSQAAGAIRG